MKLNSYDLTFHVFQMYNDTNLLLLPSGGNIKICSEIMACLFTTDEMAGGIVEPSREKATDKAELDPTRINLLKGMLLLALLLINVF